MANRNQDPAILSGKVLALDPGSACGWAMGALFEPIAEHGTWKLGNDPVKRMFSLEAKLHGIRSDNLIAVYYEMPLSRFHKAMRSLTLQEAAILRWCRLNEVPANPIPPKRIKDRSGAGGNAGKKAMAERMIDGYRLIAGDGSGPDRALTEHEIDALWLLDFARSEIEAVPAGVAL